MSSTKKNLYWWSRVIATLTSPVLGTMRLQWWNFFVLVLCGCLNSDHLFVWLKILGCTWQKSGWNWLLSLSSHTWLTHGWVQVLRWSYHYLPLYNSCLCFLLYWCNPQQAPGLHCGSLAVPGKKNFLDLLAEVQSWIVLDQLGSHAHPWPSDCSRGCGML